MSACLIRIYNEVTLALACTANEQVLNLCPLCLSTGKIKCAQSVLQMRSPRTEPVSLLKLKDETVQLVENLWR
jgi:hypothetical protein